MISCKKETDCTLSSLIIFHYLTVSSGMNTLRIISFKSSILHGHDIFLSMTNKMQRCVILIIIFNALHVSSGFSAHHQERKSVHATLGICQTCLLLPLVWQIPDAASTDLSSWWWAEKPLETCTALTIIKSIIQWCILFVMLKNTLKMYGSMNIRNGHDSHDNTVITEFI